MRILRFFLAHAALALLVLSCAGFAASNPLRSPRGLALDASGNLYVANTDGNNILVFSPSYSQLRSKTITAGINAPTSLVFDSLGNLWVANSGASNGGANGSISQYTAGVQNAGATITDGIDNPFSIAMDGIGNLFVENNYANVTVYEPQSAFSPPRFPFVPIAQQRKRSFSAFLPARRASSSWAPAVISRTRRKLYMAWNSTSSTAKISAKPSMGKLSH